MGEAPGKADLGEKSSVADVRAVAFRYLANRDHSCTELQAKLLRRGLPAVVVTQALRELEAENLLNDQRFAESFARSRINRYQGPLKIRAELIKRGIPKDLIDIALSDHAEQWEDLALQWACKRASGEMNQEEKARLYRSGANRGFTHEQMLRALDCLQSRPRDHK